MKIVAMKTLFYFLSCYTLFPYIVYSSKVENNSVDGRAN